MRNRLFPREKHFVSKFYVIAKQIDIKELKYEIDSIFLVFS